MSAGPGDFTFGQGDSTEVVDADTALMVANALPDGPQAFHLLTAALELVGDDEVLEYRIRMRLISCADAEGDVDAVLEQFNWCVERNETDPERFPAEVDQLDLVSFYSWIPRILTSTPTTSRQQALESLDALEQRLRAEGYGMAGALQERFVEAWQTGHLNDAVGYWGALQAAPEDAHSDCEVCRKSEGISFLLDLGRTDEALAAFDELVESELSCDSEPDHAVGVALVPLLRVGRFEDAERAHRLGYALVRENDMMLSTQARHAEFCALTGNYARALTLLERHLPAFGAYASPGSAHFTALLSFGVAADVLKARGLADHRLVGSEDSAVAGALGLPDVGGSVAEFGTAAWDAAARMAAAFDERNATSRYAEKLREARGRVLESYPLPLGGSDVLDTARVSPAVVPTDVEGWIDEVAWAATSADGERLAHGVSGALELKPNPRQALDLYALVASVAAAEEDWVLLDDAVAMRSHAYNDLGMEEAAAIENEHGAMLAGIMDEQQAQQVSELIETVETVEVKARLTRDLAMYLRRLGDPEGSLRAYLAAADLAEKAGQPALVREALVGACWVVPIEAEEGKLQGKLLDAAESMGPRANQVYDLAYLRTVDAYLVKQDIDLALEVSAAAVEVALENRAHQPLRQICLFRVKLLHELERCGEAAEAMHVYNQARVDLRLPASPSAEVEEAKELLQAGQEEAAFELLGAARSHLENDEMSTPGSWAMTERFYGQAAAQLGFVVTAVEAFDRAVQTGEAAIAEAPEVEDARSAAFHACQAARSIVQLAETEEHPDDVVNFGHRALALAELLQEDEPGFLAVTQGQVGRALTRLGDASGLDLLQRAEAAAREDGEDWYAAELVDSRGRALWDLGREAEALPLLLQSADQFDAVGDQVNAALAEYAAGTILRDQDRGADALTIFAGALDRVKEIEPAAHVRSGIASALADLLEAAGRSEEALQVRELI